MPRPGKAGGKALSIEGTDGADIIGAVSIPDVGSTGPGDDIVNGNGGDDWIYTYAGNDTIDGGTGDDLILPGIGDDFAFDGGYTLTDITTGKYKGGVELTYTVDGVEYTDTLVNVESIILTTAPPPAADAITFESDQTTLLADQSTSISVADVYFMSLDSGDYVVLQTTAPFGIALLGTVEDVGPLADYDGDGDDEFRIRTAADGTTHEMNLQEVQYGSDPALFDVLSVEFSGLDAGEEVIIAFVDSGGVLTEQTLTVGTDIVDGTYAVNEADVAQFIILAGTGDEFFVDDILLA